MRAGKLRHYVTIQQLTESRGADGSIVKSWSTLAAVWADIRPKGATEDYVAKGVSASVAHEIRIRYLSGVAPEMRVVYGSRTFEILGVMNFEERSREMLLICQESV